MKNIFKADIDFNYAPHNKYKGESQTKKFMFNNSNIHLNSELANKKGFIISHDISYGRYFDITPNDPTMTNKKQKENR